MKKKSNKQKTTPPAPLRPLTAEKLEHATGGGLGGTHLDPGQ